MKSLLLTHLLQDKTIWLETELEKRARTNGCYLTQAQEQIFRRIRDRDITLSQLACEMQISRQAVQKTVAGLVERRLLVLMPCQENPCARVVLITHEGQELQQKVELLWQEMEWLLEQKLGEQQLALLKEVLKHNWD